MYKQVQLCMDELFEKHLGFRGFELGSGDASDEDSGESEDDYWVLNFKLIYFFSTQFYEK